MGHPDERRRGIDLLKIAWLPACLCLSACVTTRAPPPVMAPVAWELRLPALQQTSEWTLDGRAAASVGKQGWQASLAWKQQGATTELHLTGPLGLGASVLKLTPEGLSIDGAPPRDDARQILQERLGVDLPLESLRFWLLGVPDPSEASTITRNAHDRAQQLIQSGWTVDIGRYLAVGADWLPGQLTVQRDQVRLRIAVDHWDVPR
jgi:outer membrane lipoprotein LolB